MNSNSEDAIEQKSQTLIVEPSPRDLDTRAFLRRANPRIRPGVLTESQMRYLDRLADHLEIRDDEAVVDGPLVNVVVFAKMGTGKTTWITKNRESVEVELWDGDEVLNYVGVSKKNDHWYGTTFDEFATSKIMRVLRSLDGIVFYSGNPLVGLPDYIVTINEDTRMSQLRGRPGWFPTDERLLDENDAYAAAIERMPSNRLARSIDDVVRTIEVDILGVLTGLPDVYDQGKLQPRWHHRLFLLYGSARESMTVLEARGFVRRGACIILVDGANGKTLKELATPSEILSRAWMNNLVLGVHANDVNWLGERLGPNRFKKALHVGKNYTLVEHDEHLNTLYLNSLDTLLWHGSASDDEPGSL
jgi:hypothetical protein